MQRAASGEAVIAPQCRLPYTAGLPPSPRERVSKYLYHPRFHCEAACQSRFWGRVHRSGSRRHRAAPHVADRLQSRRFCARCTVYSVVQGCQKRCLYKYRFLARFLQGLNCRDMLFIKVLQFFVRLHTVSEAQSLFVARCIESATALTLTPSSAAISASSRPQAKRRQSLLNCVSVSGERICKTKSSLGCCSAAMSSAPVKHSVNPLSLVKCAASRDSHLSLYTRSQRSYSL